METREILLAFQRGELSLKQAQASLQGFSDLGFAKVDTARKQRNGYPEVIYGQGKSQEQICEIMAALKDETSPILTTRVDAIKAEFLKARFPQGQYFETAHCFVLNPQKEVASDNYIAIVTAGTSDLSVAEEAAVTAQQFGNRVEKIYDVGVAGIHRLFNHLTLIQKARVVIVIAGMEGALASVVGGLVSAPVIAVPTSIGYGTNFQGLTALLSMLNSCASGVSVVNIDNGFGAAYNASLINHMKG
ncbi:nickel pincer cofactor biosynthesis protein LarB [Ligilactobacillus equi]|uniref:Phosphoribosylaminoimidazole carboxylase catalytic subunit n=2 Tax=Ligilactobacillus equi TaxID=137357 RepID=V7HXP4_9LACO|nr:nickel pincer cofactor biosynthesis protein LarB [Ligilactobacillus equi]ETA73806.1 phosphoribosylaminoimidazole carboxylase catalytic subunit [Ligilactobacillus equi DPC 6820]KRL82603.1 hypothetical protein FC36_GL000898 [Ligilactobacillus equi DSM 15833 = JCM 10991]MCQ2557433.1 nickel pincer cofactor biosynthesis protein LarB [Ligilactobacillus sp.]